MFKEVFTIPEAYEVVMERPLDDIKTNSLLLRHKKTGARVALLPCEDDNKVFFIGFRTPPADSTGVAHIIEHTVLCGSRDFPVKDPFVELAKGSLNTFLNAMTYSDKTVYPLASCNDTDFKNLMHVYLDAVLYPNIYRQKHIFEQEGWHYETDPETGEITINGVVYNEMKGALSSGDDVLGREIYASLYPDTPYFHESGGDPQNIPDLTYEDYLDFHRRYYHPSNSYIYLYGDMDMTERLEYLDRAYLSAFDALKIDSTIPVQEPFEAPVYVEKQYSIMEDEDEQGKAYLAWNASLGRDNLDKELMTALKVLDYVLCDMEGAPIRKALREKGLGEDVYSILELGIRQPTYSIISKYTDPERKDEFVFTIRETLEGLVREGINQKALTAGINHFEFRYREANFGSYPKGLIYGLGALDTWLYDESSVWNGLEVGGVYQMLRREKENGYFEALVDRYLLQNDHKSLLVLLPEKGLADRHAALLKKKLEDFASSLTPEEKQAIIDEEKSLRIWQETPDTEEDIRKIPTLSRKDLKREITPYVNDVRKAGDVTLLAHPLFSNRIHYLSLLFDITKLPARFYPYLGIYKAVFAAMDTENFDYAELDSEIDIYTGGIGCSVSSYTRADDVKSYRTFMEIHTKTLHENLEETFRLFREILLHTDFSDAARLREILEEERAGSRQELASSGHATALMRAMSYFSETAMISDIINGVDEYRMLDKITKDISQEGEAGEKAAADLSRTLSDMTRAIFRRENLLVDDTAEEGDLAADTALIRDFAEDLFADPLPDQAPASFVPVKKNEGFKIAGQVQFVCRAGSFLNKGLAYNGALRVMRVILGFEYLWARVRVKGGAYGCMSGFARDGASYMVSFRDPHLRQTVDVFKEAAEYIRHYDADEEQLTKSIIGTVSAMDHPMTASGLGRYSLAAYLTGTTPEQMQKERDQILDVTAEDIRSLAPYLDALIDDQCICVVGSEEKIEGARDLFDKVEKLL